MSGSQDGIEMRPREEIAVNRKSKEALQENIILARSEENAFPKVNDMSSTQVAILLLGLGFSLLLFAIDETIVATSVATIGSELGTKGSLTWITTSYLLTTTVVLPIIGRIADAVDIKTFLIVELWIFIIGNIIAGTAHSLAQLIAGRLLAGVGGAGLLNLTCIIIALMTNEKQRGAYMNLVNVVFIFGDSMGPIVGGALAHAGKWRWIFLFTAPFGPVITLFLFVTLRVPPSPARVRSFRQLVTTVDLLGMFLLIACLSCTVVAFNMGGQDLPWDSSVIIGCIVGAGVAFILFILVERKAEMPVVPIELFTSWRWRNVAIMTAMRTLTFFHLFGITFYLVMFLQVMSFSQVVSAALIVPYLILASISSVSTTYIMPYCKGAMRLRALFVVPLGILITGLALLSTLNEASSLGRIVGYTLIVGLGFGSATQTSMVIPQLGLPTQYLSTTTALLGTAPVLGGTLGVAILGTAINNIYRNALSSTPYASVLVDLNPNSVVETLSHLVKTSSEYQAVVSAYVTAWQKGCYVLVGIAALELVMCLGLKAVTFDEGVEKKEETPSAPLTQVV